MEYFFQNMNEMNILSGQYFDLTNYPYRGGTTFSSGTLPKWDVFNKQYMFKRCGADGYGNFLTDAANEELVYLFCALVGIDCAYYRL